MTAIPRPKQSDIWAGIALTCFAASVIFVTFLVLP